MRDNNGWTNPGLVDQVFAFQSVTLEPIDFRTAPEQIADRLATAIMLGEFVPGQRLPAQRELAAQLGVSRATAREALQRLAAGGYIGIHRGRTGGAIVREAWRPDSAAVVRRTLLARWDRFESLLDFGSLIEPLIARIAATRLDESDAAAIRQALARMPESGADREGSRAADEELHLAVARAAHNDYLTALSARVRVEMGLGFSATPYSPAIREKALAEHAELAEAVMTGDGDHAAEVAGRHFEIGARLIRDLVGKAR